jgi:hypothetical protein
MESGVNLTQMLRAKFAYDVRHVARASRKCCAHLPRNNRDVTFGPLCMVTFMAKWTQTVEVTANLPMRGSALFAPYYLLRITTQIGNPWRCLECGLLHVLVVSRPPKLESPQSEIRNKSCELLAYFLKPRNIISLTSRYRAPNATSLVARAGARNICVEIADVTRASGVNVAHKSRKCYAKFA